MGKIPNLTNVFQMGWKHQPERGFQPNHGFLRYFINVVNVMQGNADSNTWLEFVFGWWICLWFTRWSCIKTAWLWIILRDDEVDIKLAGSLVAQVTEQPSFRCRGCFKKKRTLCMLYHIYVVLERRLGYVPKLFPNHSPCSSHHQLLTLVKSYATPSHAIPRHRPFIVKGAVLDSAAMHWTDETPGCERPMWVKQDFFRGMWHTTLMVQKSGTAWDV